MCVFVCGEIKPGGYVGVLIGEVYFCFNVEKATAQVLLLSIRPIFLPYWHL